VAVAHGATAEGTFQRILGIRSIVVASWHPRMQLQLRHPNVCHAAQSRIIVAQPNFLLAPLVAQHNFVAPCNPLATSRHKITSP